MLIFLSSVVENASAGASAALFEHESRVLRVCAAGIFEIKPERALAEAVIVADAVKRPRERKLLESARTLAALRETRVGDGQGILRRQHPFGKNLLRDEIALKAPDVDILEGLTFPQGVFARFRGDPPLVLDVGYHPENRHRVAAGAEPETDDGEVVGLAREYRAVLLLVVEEERTVRKPADKVIAPVLLDNPVLSHADIIPKTRLVE